MYRRSAYPRRRIYSSRPMKQVKYSCEHFAISDTIPTDDDNPRNDATTMVASLATGGMRKAKNFTLDLFATSEDMQAINFALVYVPQGSSAQTLNPIGTTATSIYEPNQNVIMSGIISTDGQKNRFTTKLARNLNSGDSIGLIVYAQAGKAAVEYSASLTYSITF